MDYVEESLRGIEARLKKLESSGYKKLEGSSYRGAQYEIHDSKWGRKLVVDIRLTMHNAVIFEMYPGIRASSRYFIPSMALYCQGIKTDFGSVKIGRVSADVKFCAESCFVDHAVTLETIELMEKRGVEILEKHYDNLALLAVGKMLSVNKIEADEYEPEEYNYDFESNVRNVRDYLMHRSNLNSIGETIFDNGKTIFYCQVFTETDSYKMEFIFNKSGFLTLKGNYGENAVSIAPAYRYGVADYLNELNAKHMYGNLNVGDESQGVYCKISTSLLDGVIGDKTIEFLEYILLKTLKDSQYSIQMLAAGMIPKEDQLEKNILETMLKNVVDKREVFGRYPGFKSEVLEEGLANLRDDIDLKHADVSEISMDDFLKGLGMEDTVDETLDTEGDER